MSGTPLLPAGRLFLADLAKKKKHVLGTGTWGYHFNLALGTIYSWKKTRDHASTPPSKGWDFRALVFSLTGQSHEIFCTRFFSSISSFWSHLPFGWVIAILKWLHGAWDTGESPQNPSARKIFHICLNFICIVNAKIKQFFEWVFLKRLQHGLECSKKHKKTPRDIGDRGVLTPRYIGHRGVSTPQYLGPQGVSTPR